LKHKRNPGLRELQVLQGKELRQQLEKTPVYLKIGDRPGWIDHLTIWIFLKKCEFWEFSRG
jgi:hypothetical protein